MAFRRKAKTSNKRQRKRLIRKDSSSTSSSQSSVHKPLINVNQRLDAAVHCSSHFVPDELSGIIGGYFQDCLAHDVWDRIQANYYELEYKTRFSQHAQALLQEIVGYMQDYKDNTAIVIAPTIHLMSSLFYANPGIKSDVFLGSFSTVFQAVNKDCDKLGFLLLEFLFGVFDSYIRNADSTSTPTVATWNSTCVEHLLDTGAADLILKAASDLGTSLSTTTSDMGKYTAEDTLRIGWVVAKVFCIYLRDHSSSPHADTLSKFNDISTSIEAKIEELTEA